MHLGYRQKRVVSRMRPVSGGRRARMVSTAVGRGVDGRVVSRSSLSGEAHADRGEVCTVPITGNWLYCQAVSIWSSLPSQLPGLAIGYAGCAEGMLWGHG